MNRDGIRIEKIKNDHAELLKKVRESIVANHENLKGNIEEVINVIDFDEKSIKQQEATLKAQELVTTLTKEILEAKTKEEVFEIRKRLNYYMNKIKAEIKKRGLDESYLNDYQEKITYLRKDIAKYIRFLKREDNIAEMDRLYTNYNNLNKEEMNDLKKTLRKEVNYNRRNLREPKEEDIGMVSEEQQKMEVLRIVSEDKPKIVSAAAKKALSDSFEIVENPNPFKITKTAEKPIKIAFDISDSNVQHQRPGNQIQNLKTNDYNEKEQYLRDKVKIYNEQYHIHPTIDYTKDNSGKNMLHFFRNLPSYIHNKKAIKQMEKDYYTYYKGSDLKSYIEYLKQRNSISQGLKCIFNKTHLYDNNNLIKHENCATWLNEFCQINEMEIVLPQQFEKIM